MFKVILFKDEPGINMKKGLGREKRDEGDRRGRYRMEKEEVLSSITGG